MKTLSPQAIILKALKVKDVSKFKHIELLEAMGFTLKDEGHSTQGYHSVHCEKTDRFLAISKDYGNKVRLYDGYHAIDGSDKSIKDVLDSVDLHGLLTKRPSTMAGFVWKGSYTKNGYHRNNKVPVACFPHTKTMQYKNLKDEYARNNYYRLSAIESYKQLEEEIEKLRSKQQDCVKREIGYEKDKTKVEVKMEKLTNAKTATFIKK